MAFAAGGANPPRAQPPPQSWQAMTPQSRHCFAALPPGTLSMQALLAGRVTGEGLVGGININQTAGFSLTLRTGNRAGQRGGAVWK